jgi:hypothetical protein
VLPTGRELPASPWTNLRYRDVRRIGDAVDRAYAATADYLAEQERSA